MARPSRPWFRFYVEAVHDRKLRRLPPETRWLFVACLAAARQSPEPGWLLVGVDDPMLWDDVCDFAAMPLKQVEKGMDALQDAGVLDNDLERGAWFIPNWNERQFESDDVTARVQRSKERRKAVGSNVAKSLPGTPPETEADTDTDPCLSVPVTRDGGPQAVESEGRCDGEADWASSVAAVRAIRQDVFNRAPAFGVSSNGKGT